MHALSASRALLQVRHSNAHMLAFQHFRLISNIYSKLYYGFKSKTLSRIMPFYAVAKGVRPGVYTTWDECKKQIDGFKNARYKKFKDEADAQVFVNSLGCVTLPIKATENTVLISDSDDEIFASLDHPALNNPCSAGRSNASATKRKLTASSNGDQPPPKKDKPLDVEFKYDADGFVEVYTDGACQKNGKNNAKAGLGVFFGEGHPLNSAEPVSGRATNNCGEIQAATKAVKQAKTAGVKKLCIYTDSQFVINSMTKWLNGWKRKNWKLADGSPVKNKEDFQELDQEVRHMQIKWIYVKAHRGIFGNERADELARQGAKMYKRKF